MNRYDRFYDEACREAHEVINGWMNEQLRAELSADSPNKSGIGDNWHEDSDAILQKFLDQDGNSYSAKINVSDEVDIYNNDDSIAVNSLMKNMRSKLESSNLADYENKQKKKQVVSVRDPRIAMEMRQRKVKEARKKRELEVKKRMMENIQKKQNDALAKEIVKQESFEKAEKERREEIEIQREMAKIRKQMLELKKKHQKETEMCAIKSSNSSPVIISTASDLTMDGAVEIPLNQSISASIISLSESSQETIKANDHCLANLNRFETFQRQKLTRRCFQHWIKIVLAKRAAMGKAKALSDWHLIVKVWSAWKKYYFMQVSERDTEIYVESMKQMKVQDHKACEKHRRHLVKKCFRAWKKYVKIERYSKDLMIEQEETKQKMKALLGAVTTQAKSNDLVLQTIEDDNDSECFSEPIKTFSFNTVQSKADKVASSNKKQGLPMQAWQVRRSDVHKLTLQQLENMAEHGQPPGITATKVKSIQSAVSTTKSGSNRFQASKQVIAQQRQMISEQKKIIELQKQKLEEKALSSGDVPNTHNDLTAVSNFDEKQSVVKTFQLPKRPKSLLAMEKRAAERMKRKEELQEKRRLAEKAKLEQMKLEEEERIKREEEQKKKHLEELRRLKQLEIEKENERKAFLLHMARLRKTADNHYKSVILRKYGLVPWKKLMHETDSKLQVARYHYEKVCLHHFFVSWHETVVEENIQKQSIAAQHYNKLLTQRYFGNWMKYGETMSILEQKANIHYNHHLKIKFIRKWERYITNERLSYFEKEEMAVSHNRLRLKRRVFKILFVYKQNIKREEIRSQRIADMRRKVAELLPDFSPGISQDMS